MPPTCSPLWHIVAEPGGGNTRHVVPVGDTMDHDIDWRCVCGTRSELVRVGSIYGLAILHEALDGRTGYLETMAPRD